MVDVAVVGLGFGGDFVPIYASHPDVGRVAVVDTEPERLAVVGERFGIAERYDSLEALLAGDGFDAVHVATPVAFHANQCAAVLNSGRHCACAVPMATSLGDIERVMAAQRASGRVYMMMETAVFAREFFYARDLYRRGELGALTFFRGVHIQNLDGYPRYWMGYPPMHYITHALAPALALAGTRVRDVRCLGSGQLTGERVGDYENPYPLESGVFRLDRDELAAEVTMSFFQTGRAYQEGFSVYGDQGGVEWPAVEGDPLLVHRLRPVEPGRRGRGVDVARVEPPDRAELLPAEIARFTRPAMFDPGGGRAPVRVGAGHGGSHPHLAHEFVRAIVENRAPFVDAATATDWTAPGICAHQSALHDGQTVAVPSFR